MGSRPHDVIISEDGSLAFASNRGEDTVSVIDTQTRQVIHTITSGAGPYGGVVAPGSQFIYFANATGNSVTVIDTEKFFDGG